MFLILNLFQNDKVFTESGKVNYKLCTLPLVIVFIENIVKACDCDIECCSYSPIFDFQIAIVASDPQTYIIPR